LVAPPVPVVRKFEPDLRTAARRVQVVRQAALDLLAATSANRVGAATLARLRLLLWDRGAAQAESAASLVVETDAQRERVLVWGGLRVDELTICLDCPVDKAHLRRLRRAAETPRRKAVLPADRTEGLAEQVGLRDPMSLAPRFPGHRALPQPRRPAWDRRKRCPPARPAPGFEREMVREHRGVSLREPRSPARWVTAIREVETLVRRGSAPCKGREAAHRESGSRVAAYRE
jgi:hypothetical protein